jgi:hypothetical protein
MFVGNTIYSGILLSVAIELYYGEQSAFRYSDLFAVVYSPAPRNTFVFVSVITQKTAVLVCFGAEA